MFLQGNLISFTRGMISRIIFNVECAAFIKKMSKLLYITQDWNGHWRKKKRPPQVPLFHMPVFFSKSGVLITSAKQELPLNIPVPLLGAYCFPLGHIRAYFMYFMFQLSISKSSHFSNEQRQECFNSPYGVCACP